MFETGAVSSEPFRGSSGKLDLPVGEESTTVSSKALNVITVFPRGLERVKSRRIGYG